MLTADHIASKTNGMGRGEVPIGASHVTVFIDVQAKLLFWAVAGWWWTSRARPIRSPTWRT